MRRLIRAELTKLRSVRSWGVAMFLAVGLTLLVTVITAAGSSSDANRYWSAPNGPDGTAVVDEFHFVHRPLDGDGSITARVLGLTGREGTSPGWAKAGVIVKES